MNSRIMGGEAMEWKFYNHQLMVAQSGEYRIWMMVDCATEYPHTNFLVFAGVKHIGSPVFFREATALCEVHKAEEGASKPKEPEYEWVMNEESKTPRWSLYVGDNSVGVISYIPAWAEPYRTCVSNDGMKSEWGSLTLRAAKESVERYLRNQNKMNDITRKALSGAI